MSYGKNIKDYFLTFKDWYNDPVLYHLVGYLVTAGSNIAHLKNAATTRTKDEFMGFLKAEIKKTMQTAIDDLTWANRQAVRNVLLLFNIQTLLDNELSYIRFPFDRYKVESWDIEHIRSRQSEIKSNEDRRKWLKSTMEYFTGMENEAEVDEAELNKLEDEDKVIITDIINLLSERIIPDAPFDLVYRKLADRYGEGADRDGDDDISNLTLLDASMNRGYKNDFFPIKRRKIIGRDKQGTFIPLCTKNVFLKYYSSSVKDMYTWSEHDANDYQNSIAGTLKEYLPQSN